ncbi:hypothetical protein AAG906_017501 [Vitis piasezkii]
MKEVPRGGRRWFAVESKSFELLIDDAGGKLRGCIWERCGITSWIRFGDLSLSSLLAGVETCCRGRDDRSWSLVWEEEGRKYRLERRSNEAGRFLLCSIRDLEAKRFCLIFPEGKGLSGGWNILAKKLREVGVVPLGGLKDPLSIEVLKKEKELEPRTYADVAKSKTGRLGDKVWLELGRRVMLGRLEQLDRYIVGRWENVSIPFPELDFLKNWAFHAWLLKGRLNIVVLGRGLLLFEFELLSEAERVLARGKRRVKDNVLFLEKWHPEVGREVFKLIGDGCGGFIAVDKNADSMAELQWARMLVKVVGRDLPTSVQIVVGLGCFSVQLWWETPPWFSQVVPEGSLLGKGVTVDEEEARGGSRAACRGRVLEKEGQYKKQTGVQVVSSCGSSSKSDTGFSSDSAKRRPGPEAIDGEDSLGNKGQGVGEVVKEASHAQVSEDERVDCFLGGDLRDSEVFSVNARAMMTDEVLAAEASRCDRALVVGGVSGSKGVDNVEGVGFQAPLCVRGKSLWVISLRLLRHCRKGRFLAVVGMKVACLGMGRFLEWGALNARGAARGVLVGMEVGLFSISCRFKNCEDGFGWIFSRVYELGAIRGLWNDPWCIGGDFNMIRFPNERRRRGRVSPSMRRFSEVIDDLDLRDLPLQGARYWSEGLNSQGGVRRGLVPFRFENMWLKEEGFKDLLKGWWQVDFWDSQEKLRFLSMEELEARKEAKGDFEKWVLMEEISWRQKSREVWLRKEEQEIKGGVVRDFKNLLIDPSAWHPTMEGLDFNRIDVEEAARLEEVFTEEEVLSALSNLNEDKAPGPDGFSQSFWQFCLEFVKEEVMGFLKEFHEHGRFVVSSAQNAFVEGRQILDAALIANEYGFWGEVDWLDFLMHFHNNIFYLDQWHPGGFLQQFKGVVSRGSTFSLPLCCRIKGRSGDGVLVSHLLFADNTLVFMNWLLMWFEVISGLRINLDKSEILSIGRVKNLEVLALEVGCKVGRLSTSYLGLPLGANHKSVAIWDGRFANERETLWRHVISRKFGEEEGGWYTREVREGFGVGFWKEIRKEGSLLQNKVVFSVVNGRIVKFWKDKWCGNFALCNSIPSLYAFASYKEAWLVELWDPSGEEGVWSPRFSRPFND